MAELYEGAVSESAGSEQTVFFGIVEKQDNSILGLVTL
jgi:hypothetical protein